MSNYLLTGVLFIATLSSCVSTSNKSKSTQIDKRKFINNTQPITSSFDDVNTVSITNDDFLGGKTPDSLMALPRTEDGAFVLSPGYYEANFKSYCLQPGTPAPSGHDAYFLAPLNGSRKGIIETILRKSQKESHLEQKNIQLLLWSVVSRSDFNKLSSDVQSTAMQLLSPKQLFELQGGMLAVVKTVANVLPSAMRQNKLQHLFDLGISSYEAFEQLAVVSGPSQIRQTDFKRDQWYKHENGYFVRYYPNGYQQTKIQVYLPGVIVDSAAHEIGNNILFDPASMVVVPANSNAQRLGIGGPVREVVRAVIGIIGSGKEKSPRPKDTPPVGHPGSSQDR